MTVALSLAALSLAIWIALGLSPTRRWPRDHILPVGGGAGAGADEVRAVVPARNEAEGLPGALPSLLGQRDVLASVTLVDDRSTDATAAVARRLAVESGSEVALEGDGQAPPADRWVFFTDADIRHPPDGVRRLLAQATAQSGPFDLVSVMARLRTDSFWEKVLMPAFVWFFHVMYPFRASSRERSKVASWDGRWRPTTSSPRSGTTGSPAPTRS